jgi:hypothetical protein
LRGMRRHRQPRCPRQLPALTKARSESRVRRWQDLHQRRECCPRRLARHAERCGYASPGDVTFSCRLGHC